MDKITFDFENGIIEINTKHQQGTLEDPELKTKKAAILKASGLVEEDVTNVVEIFTNYVNGFLTKEDMETLLDKDITGTYGE